MAQHLSLQDFGAIAAAVLDVPTQDLLATCDTTLALSALDAPTAGFNGVEVYPTMAAKASALVYRLCRNRPLLDGNQRTAHQALHEFMARNGLAWGSLPGDDASRVAAVLKSVADGETTEKELTDWISERIGGPR